MRDKNLKNQRERERYQNDPDFRAKKIMDAKAYYRDEYAKEGDAATRQSAAEKERKRYRSNLKYREKKKADSKLWRERMYQDPDWLEAELARRSIYHRKARLQRLETAKQQLLKELAVFEKKRAEARARWQTKRWGSDGRV